VELLEGRIDNEAANGVHSGTQSALLVALSYFLELKSELELLGSGRNMDLTEDMANALWTWVSAASDSLESHVPPSVAHNPPEDAGGGGVVVWWHVLLTFCFVSKKDSDE
jgi:hypothetical protein